MARARLRSAAAIAAAALAFGAAPAVPPDVRSAAGGWDLSLDGSHRKCRLTLAVEEAGLGRALRFPATCRRSLAVLARASWWSIEDGAIRLLDGEGRLLLRFEKSGEAESVVAKTEAGETYRLEPKDKPLIEARAPALPPLPPIGVPQPTPIDPAKAPRPETLPGQYIVDRYIERDTCRIALATATVTPRRFALRLAEGCRDGGLAAFDPVAWRYEGGRLTITSRRGHEVTLVSERDGHWRRDPEIGATLVLRKAP